ncbi:MAG: hypothetical protein HKP61_07945 [Dactylosporangium sp.]|nr:hypothetical protein [Dactylosporangium sp.]NNJ60868.1 hypothetical protein [Dactylosporangium sp.]
MARQWLKVAGGLVAVGVAAGVAASLVKRCRAEGGWQECCSAAGVDESDECSLFEAAKTAISEVARSAASLHIGRVAPVTDEAGEQPADLIGMRNPDQAPDDAA